MKRLIDVKWQKFGRQGAVSNLGLNLIYAILWTILAVTSPKDGDELYLPWSRKAWRLVISVVVCLMTIDEIRKQVTGIVKLVSDSQVRPSVFNQNFYTPQLLGLILYQKGLRTLQNLLNFFISFSFSFFSELQYDFLFASRTLSMNRVFLLGTIRTRRRQQKWISWRATELGGDLAYCHPRWPQEEMYLKSEIKAIRDTPLISSGDSWIYFDWFTLLLILGTIASHVVFFNINSQLTQIVHSRIITVLLLVLWLRIMQYARPFEGAGPFVAIFSHIAKDIVNWGILTLLITIPYACAFWITFGEVSNNPVPSYSDISSLLYWVILNDRGERPRL